MCSGASLNKIFHRNFARGSLFWPIFFFVFGGNIETSSWVCLKMRDKKTEPAFSGAYLDEEREGIYTCAICSQPLFDSKNKFTLPGCGWALFTQAIDSKSVFYREDWSIGFKRYEVLCRSCESHLGHVFKDGPPPKYLRYTINSLALRFKDSLLWKKEVKPGIIPYNSRRSYENAREG